MRISGTILHVLACLALAVLPPAACCCGLESVPDKTAKSHQPPRATCCHQPRGESEAPARPLRGNECGCETPATVAAKTIDIDFGKASPVAITATSFDSVLSRATRANAVGSPDTGPPPPYVLHCVWLC